MSDMTNAHEIEKIVADDDAIPIPPTCHRSGKEIDWSDGVIFLENGQPVKQDFHRIADTVCCVERHYGHHNNTGPFTEWLEITRRVDVEETFLSLLKSRITRAIGMSNTNE